MLTSRQSVQILCLSGALGLILPFLVQHGMFMDGTQYAVVSRNLANGAGTFWFPVLSPTWFRAGNTFFMEQPPLFYFLEAQIFSLFGDSIFSERIFCFICLALATVLINILWRTLTISKPEMAAWGWLPPALFMITPVVFWTYRNNMIEMLLTCFVLAASICIIRGIVMRLPFSLFFGGILILFGALTKGLPALFPLALPFCWFLVYKDISFARMLGVFTLIFVSFTGPLVVLLAYNSQAYEGLSFYFYERVLGRLTGEPIVANKMITIYWLTMELVVMGSIIALVALVLRKRTGPVLRQHASFAALFGLCGVIPLLLTPVQRNFYIVPALPFFAITAAAVVTPRLNAYFSSVTLKAQYRLQLATVVSGLILISLTALKFGDTSRDRLILDDVHSIAAKTGEESSLVSEYDVYSRWDVQFYLLRYHKIAIGKRPDSLAPFYLTMKEQACPIGYNPCEINLNTLNLCCSTQAVK